MKNTKLTTKQCCKQCFAAIPVLSLEVCVDLKLIKRLNALCNTNRNQLEKQKLSIYKSNASSFEGLRCFSDICIIKLARSATPSIHMARRIPLTVKDKSHKTI